MTAGFPEGTPLRRAANFTYNHVAAVQFLRTTYKAGPLVALGIAGLAGLAAARSRALAVACVALAALASWPLVRGRGAGRPAAVAARARGLAAGRRARGPPRRRRARRRAPGPALRLLPLGRDDRPDPARRWPTGPWPCATPSATPTCAPSTCCGRSTRWSQQRRALPGQLVAAARPDGRAHGGQRRRRRPHAQRRRARGRGGRRARPARAPGRALGPRARPPAAPPGTLRRAPPRCPRCAPGTGPRRPGWCGVEPRTGGDGRRRLGGGARGPGGVRRAAPRRGRATPATDAATSCAGPGDVVITDSNRRRVLVVSRLAQNPGATLAADEAPSVDAAVLDPFPRAAATRRPWPSTTAIAVRRAPFSPGFPQFPERRPFAALDGDPATPGRPTATSTPDRHTLDVAFDRAARRRPRRPAALRRRARDGDRRRGRRAPLRRACRAGTGCGSGCAACARCGCGSPRSASRRTRRPARAGSASCGSRACGRPRRCACPCWPSARWPAATSHAPG